MDFDMFRHDGAGNDLARAETNSAIIKDACPHDGKASADDHEGKPGTVEGLLRYNGAKVRNECRKRGSSARP